MGKVRTAIVAVVCAVLGAVAGRAVVQWRRQTAAGRQPNLDFAALQPGPREVVSGLVAALRVQDRPWSYLRIPSWLAAFAVNLAVGALAQELAPLLRAFGIATPEAPVHGGSNGARAAGIVTSEIWTAETLSPSPEPPSPPGPHSPLEPRSPLDPGFRPFNR